jgi:hypothetical protein
LSEKLCKRIHFALLNLREADWMVGERLAELTQHHDTVFDLGDVCQVLVLDGLRFIELGHEVQDVGSFEVHFGGRLFFDVLSSSFDAVVHTHHVAVHLL